MPKYLGNNANRAIYILASKAHGLNGIDSMSGSDLRLSSSGVLR